ncbi:MAG: hypothetical protein SGI84_14010 [Gemmatimonadota bacterium]|nr:hypothetical protein [Gemmatimonadota bacterium]
MSSEKFTAFAVAAPGLEPLVVAELQRLGLLAHQADPGGVEFETDLIGLYRANLHLRVASRVLVRIAAFKAAHFSELERHASTIPWAQWIGAGGTAHFRITSKKSRLYHQKAIADRLEAALRHAVPGVTTVRGAADTEPDAEVQQFVVRLAYDQCTISADSSGALLHRRGYRQAVAKAPLRETLAAAMLLGVPWDPAEPLVDPMCGSGTIAIEAALLARRIPPGWQRSFGFEHWPGFAAPLWHRVRDAARADILDAAPAPIHATDRDAGAMAAALANAERAGVAQDLVIERRPLSGLGLPGGRGLVLTNPPYGLRIGEATQLRDLFAQLGNLMRQAPPGWKLGLLSANPMLERRIGLPITTLWTTTNGGIPVRLLATPDRVPLPSHAVTE